MSSSSTTSKTISSNVSFKFSDPQEDDVVPSKRQISETFARGNQIWRGLHERATSMRLQHNTIDLARLNHDLPTIPDDLHGVNELSGQATWEMVTPGCDTPLRTMTEAKRRWSLTRQRPTPCMISEHSPFSFSDSSSNGIAFLFLGWAYILCMAMLEKQRIPMCYSRNTSASTDHERPSLEHEITADIGLASEDELRWWTSLLSQGQGWRSADGKQPVWAVLYTGNVKVRFVARLPPSTSLNPGPPSSKQAVKLLSRFVSIYNLENQVPLALAMALTIPLHNDTVSIVKLPRPHLTKQCAPTESLSNVEREYSNLGRYMTLSSNPVFLSSALWAVFWEPGVDCNLVSPWFDAIIEVVEPLVDRGDFEMLGHVLALRRPSVAPLWYGIAACGQTETLLAIVPFLRTLYTPVPSRPIPEVAAWTGSPQSFMDLWEPGAYIQAADQVARADVWRLRHECWSVEPEGAPFRNTPMCPWPPFGFMRVDELELQVRRHTNCDRHRWVCVRWTWLLDNGTVWVEESSLPKDHPPSFEAKSHVSLTDSSLLDLVCRTDHVASERAVGDIFRWVATEMEPTGKAIYQHPWVDALADLEIGQTATSDLMSRARRSPSDSTERVEDWIMGIDLDVGYVTYYTTEVNDAMPQVSSLYWREM